MVVRHLRVVDGLLLVASGALLYAASWQRWAGVCEWNQTGGRRCAGRQDDRFEFHPVFDPWEPVGNAAQLAGASLLVLAIAFVLLPWALTGRRPGPVTGVALAVVVLIQVAVGVSNIRSGLTGSTVEPIFGEATIWAWFYLPIVLLVRFAFGARGWALGAAVGLILANPLVALFSYYHGPFDARPWYEAISAVFTVVAGACLLAAAVVDSQDRVPERPFPTVDRDPAPAAGPAA